MSNAFITMIDAAEEIFLALLQCLIKVIALCTLIASTPDATFNANVAVGLLANLVLAGTRQPIELVSLEALVAD